MMSRLGIPRTPYLAGVCGLSSTLIFTNLTLPSYSLASSSIEGAMALHGPHHGAQKSIRTGLSDFKTSLSKLESVTWRTLSFAIACSPNLHYVLRLCPNSKDACAGSQGDLSRAPTPAEAIMHVQA